MSEHTNKRTETHARDLISREKAIDAVNAWLLLRSLNRTMTNATSLQDVLRQLPSAQQEIIRCRKCKFASGDSRICMKFGHSPIGELDFCAWAERRTDE